MQDRSVSSLAKPGKDKQEQDQEERERNNEEFPGR
jgi:hypothetical protein